MKIINVKDVPEDFSISPKGKFGRGVKDLSVALGRKPESTDLRERQPFDVQVCRIPAGKSRCPYHLHTSQFEYFQVLSGSGIVRHHGGTTKVGPGDAFQFGPNEPHQLSASETEEVVLLIVADNPLSEACYYPDSGKWAIEAPNGPIVKGAPEVEYFDGEE